MEYFDLTKNSIDDIAIYCTNDKLNCFVSEVNNKAFIYSGFILSNKIQVQTICNINFYPSSKSGKYIPRLEFKIINKKTNQTKTTAKEFVRISFSNSEDGHEEFWKMIAFLYRFKDLVDLGEFEKSYKVVMFDAYTMEFKDKSEMEKIKSLKSLFKISNLKEQQLQTILNDVRIADLEKFKKLLNLNGALEVYMEKYRLDLKGNGEEAVWHHFLKSHKWMLGLSTAIRFIRDFTDEAKVGIEDSAGKGSPKVDMLGLADYTSLIEIKTANTKIFTELKRSSARANTWSFSDEFLDGVSQALAQKASWDESHKAKDLIKDGKVLNQDIVRTKDARTIFLIGNKKIEMPEESTEKIIISKRDTFELFRRNNRNLEIVTYDELYERSYFSVYGKLPEN